MVQPSFTTGLTCAQFSFQKSKVHRTGFRIFPAEPSPFWRFNEQVHAFSMILTLPNLENIMNPVKVCRRPFGNNTSSLGR